jgi:hypothetical protein
MCNRWILLSFVLMLLNTSCMSKQHQHKPHENGFATEFNARFNNKELFIACVTLNELAGLDSLSIFQNNDKFIKIAGIIQSSNLNRNTVDSGIQAYIEKNKPGEKLLYDSMSKFYSFIKSYNISNMIFSPAMSDESDTTYKILRKKIDANSGLKTIFDQYLPEGRSPSSLSSGEGVALDIQLSYYLCLQNEKKRRDIVKALL